MAFGEYHHRYSSGHEGRGAAAGFSPRTAATVVHLADGISRHTEAMDRLGPYGRASAASHRTDHLTDLSKADLAVLEEILAASYATLTAGTYVRTRR